jgi:hypothetical protein
MKTLFDLNKFYRISPPIPATLKKAAEIYRAGLPTIHGTIETLTATRDGMRTPLDLSKLDDILLEHPEAGSLYQWARSDYVRFVGDYRLFLAWSDISLSVSASSESEAHLRSIAGVFEGEHVTGVVHSPTQDRKSFTVFVGHGGNPAWRELKDHLRDLHHYSIDHYERVSNSGLPIWSRVHMMLQNATMAVIVLTAEDIGGDEGQRVRARQNVIHELGLCQGRFGVTRTLPLVERGVEIPSNILGLEHIPFDAGRIREAFGHVLAAIRREFPESY